jgi:preprotein translocase subunit SecB
VTVQTHHHYQIAFQYVLNASFVGSVKPYEVKAPLQQQLTMHLAVEPLPQPQHHRVELTAHLTATTDDAPAYAAEVRIEAVVVASSGLLGSDLQATLRTEVAAALAGSVRSTLSNISQGTGFAPIVLPPFSADRLALLSEPPAK